MCFLQAAGSQQLQLIPKIRETCCGKYICNNVCFGMTTFKRKRRLSTVWQILKFLRE